MFPNCLGKTILEQWHDYFNDQKDERKGAFFLQ